MRFSKITGLVILIMILIYFLGPRPARPLFPSKMPIVPSAGEELENYISAKESSHQLKPDNQARIIWHDSNKVPTEYSVVYLHGFSASQEEGDPVHTSFAKKLGANLYLSRLAEHGIDTTEAMANLTTDKLWASALEALAIGNRIGKKVILMGTSTGGTLALKLAADYPQVEALILLSPNIAINDNAAWVLNNPWGLQVARMIRGNYNTAKDTTEMYKRYWYHRYRIESAVHLQELLETTMRASVFEKIRQPVLMLYYYRDEENQDKVVKVSAMKRMFAQLGTPTNKKLAVAVPAAGDHVIGSWIKSKDVKTVEREMENFAIKVLQVNSAER